jgi:hypothetical protein
LAVTKIKIKNEQLDESRLYSPVEVVENGWILSKAGNRNHSSYNFVLKELRDGNLIGIDISRENSKTIYWRILGSEIKRYMEEN